MSNDFCFCPKCGLQNIKYMEDKVWKCSDCGFTLYNNVAAAVGVILSDCRNNMLLEKRAREPRSGFLAVPGGFVNPCERAEAAAARECLEELGIKLEAETFRFVGTFPNVYEYKGITYKTCDLFFAAALPVGVATIEELISAARQDASEVSGLVAAHVACEEELENLPLAFDSARQALRLWLSSQAGPQPCLQNLR